MRNLIMVVIASLITMMGLVLAIMPIPGGVLVSPIGITLLIYYSPRAKHSIQWVRSQVNWVNRLFSAMEKYSERYLPQVSKILAYTRPIDGTIAHPLTHDAYLKRAKQQGKQRKHKILKSKQKS